VRNLIRRAEKKRRFSSPLIPTAHDSPPFRFKIAQILADRPGGDAYRARTDGSDPVYTAYNAYVSVLAYAEAVEKADTLDTDAVIEELKTVSMTGPPER